MNTNQISHLDREFQTLAQVGLCVRSVETVDYMVLKTLNFDCFLWNNENDKLGI